MYRVIEKIYQTEQNYVCNYNQKATNVCNGINWEQNNLAKHENRYKLI